LALHIKAADRREIKRRKEIIMKMHTVGFMKYGGPEVLKLYDLPENPRGPRRGADSEPRRYGKSYRHHDSNRNVV
jgi:hypothetical protein